VVMAGNALDDQGENTLPGSFRDHSRPIAVMAAANAGDSMPKMIEPRQTIRGIKSRQALRSAACLIFLSRLSSIDSSTSVGTGISPHFKT
jgi:hypothetical protein